MAGSKNVDKNLDVIYISASLDSISTFTVVQLINISMQYRRAAQSGRQGRQFGKTILVGQTKTPKTPKDIACAGQGNLLTSLQRYVKIDALLPRLQMNLHTGVVF